MKIVLIDYGGGNLHSVAKALTMAGLGAQRCSKPDEARDADALVLPGQGHFRQVMESFLESGFEPVVRYHLANQRPFLGICVGLQLLMEASEEAPDLPGLGLLRGTVRRFLDPRVSIPQMGWNQIFRRGDPPLLRGLPDGGFVYFANSYYPDFRDNDLSGAVTRYGNVEFTSLVSNGNLHATQFHPEKSQTYGLKILHNFRKVVYGGESQA